MRTVPLNLHLKPRYQKSLTKEGRSFSQPSASQSTAQPSSPATEVNVPHSCTVRYSGTDRSPEGTDGESEAIKNTAAETVRVDATARARRMVDFIGVVLSLTLDARPRDFFPLTTSRPIPLSGHFLAVPFEALAFVGCVLCSHVSLQPRRHRARLPPFGQTRSPA